MAAKAIKRNLAPQYWEVRIRKPRFIYEGGALKTALFLQDVVRGLLSLFFEPPELQRLVAPGVLPEKEHEFKAMSNESFLPISW